MKHLFKTAANFFAVSTLLTLLILPLFFAANFAKVAGEKDSTEYLAISHADNFPNLDITGGNGQYQVSFMPVGAPQTFLGIMILVNPTNIPKTYSLEESAPDVEVFFGQDPENRASQITMSPHAQTSISLYSISKGNQTFSFRVETK